MYSKFMFVYSRGKYITKNSTWFKFAVCFTETKNSPKNLKNLSLSNLTKPKPLPPPGPPRWTCAKQRPKASRPTQLWGERWCCQRRQEISSSLQVVGWNSEWEVSQWMVNQFQPRTLFLWRWCGTKTVLMNHCNLGLNGMNILLYYVDIHFEASDDAGFT